MSCSEDGPQSCSIAEYATYEDPENGRMIENTNNFTIEEGMIFSSNKVL